MLTKLEPQRSRRWQVLGWLLRAALEFVPRQARFTVIRWCAKAVRPFLQSTPGQKAWALSLREAGARQFDGPNESALYLVCEKLSSYGARFDPRVVWERVEVLASAYAEGKGVLLIGPHTMLCKFALRWMHDHHMQFSVFATARVHIPGADAEAELLFPSSSSMLRARKRLLEGCVVAAMIDRKDRDERRNIEVSTPAGPMRISEGVLKLALRSNSKVVFLAARLNGAGLPVVRFEAAPAGPTEVHSLVRAFAEFVTTFFADGAVIPPPGEQSLAPAVLDTVANDRLSSG